MVWVNLLPWRQAERQKRWRLWRLLGGLLLLALGILLLGGQWQRRLNQQQAVTLAQWAAAQDEAVALQGRWLAAQQQLKQLQQQRERLQLKQQQLKRWHEFSRALGPVFPVDVWLNALHKTPQGLALSGMGKSIQPLHQLRDRLAEITLFNQVTLGAIQRTRTGELTFDMQAVFASPEGEGK